MAGRRYKLARKLPVDDDARRRRNRPWSELPDQIINPSIHPHIINPSIHPHILEEKLHPNNCSSHCITKSWVPTTTRCNKSHQRPKQLYQVIITSRLSSTEYLHSRRRHDDNFHFLGDSSIIDAAYEMPDASHWCLLKSDITARTHPPPTIPSNRWPYSFGPTLPLQLNSIHGGPTTTGLTVYYTVRGHRYVSIRHECTTPDPFDAKKKLMEFGSLVGCGGKFYAVSLQGTLAVMQVNDARLKITAMSSIRAVPSVSSRFFEEYLVEIEGEIVLVFLIYRKTLAVVDHVEVFRLDLAKLDWVRVERLRGKTTLLKEKCIWVVDSAGFGCKDDCVYFAQGEGEGEDNSWRVFDMKTCCISPVSMENWTTISL